MGQQFLGWFLDPWRNLRRVAGRLGIVFLCLALWLPAGVRAQESADFARVSVDLWPEFDRPTMLVMYNIELGANVGLPATVQMQIPASVGVPSAVAVCQDDGCFNTTYTQDSAGEWTTLNIQATRPNVRVEYYDADLIKDGSARHYEYTWPGGHRVDDFKITLQQPVGASNLQIKPGTVTTDQGSDGLTYHTLEVGSLKADQTVEVVIDYQKSGDQLTYQDVPVEPSGPLESSAAGRSGLTSSLPIALGLLGLALIAGGGFWYWLSGRRQTKSDKVTGRGRRKPAGAAEAKDGEADGGHVYCHQCGKRATPGDRFCRTCGTPLRLG
jgi:hypothetical protein